MVTRWERAAGSGEIGMRVGNEEVQTTKYKISHKDTLQHREHSQYFRIPLNGI